MNSKVQKITIIGAGIAGLSAAYELKKAGLEVEVFEKNPYPGGRMSTDNSKTFPFDRGADFMIDKWYSLLESFSKELNIPWILSEDKSRHRVMRDGIPRYIDVVGPLSIFNFDVLPLRARFSFLLLLIKIIILHSNLNFFDLSKNSTAYDKSSAHDYLVKHVGQDISDYVADPFTSIMQFHRADEISVGALFALLSEMIKFKGFRVSYTSGGMGEIPKALAKYVGNIHYETITKSITEFSSDAIIIATPAHEAEMIDGIPIEAKSYLSQVKYASTSTVSFCIPCTMFSDNTHLTYVPFVENKIIAGYDNTIRKDIQNQNEGRSIINVYLHEYSTDIYKNMNDAELFDFVKKELLLVCPEAKENAEEIEPYMICRLPMAMPKFTGVHVSATRKFLSEFQGKNNIYFAGDYLNSPWAEGAARSGQRVAKLIIAKNS